MVVVEENHALAMRVADHHVAEDGGAVGAGAQDDVVAFRQRILKGLAQHPHAVEPESDTDPAFLASVGLGSLSGSLFSSMAFSPTKLRASLFLL
jgi:hypothetical protein